LQHKQFKQILDPNQEEFGLVEIVTPKLAYLIKEMSDDILMMSEQDLINAGNINEIDWKLRIKFWHEFRTITDPNLRGTRVPKMKLTNIYGGICEAITWNYKIEDPYKLAFIIRPINDFEEETEIILQLGAKRLWEIMTMDITGKDGKVDAKRGQLLLQAITLAADRARGLAIMRSQSINVNLDKKDSQSIGAINKISDVKELDSKIKELTLKLGSHQADVIDTEAIDG